jgi:hypothetical protein
MARPEGVPCPQPGIRRVTWAARTPLPARPDPTFLWAKARLFMQEKLRGAFFQTMPRGEVYLPQAIRALLLELSLMAPADEVC